MTMNNVTMNTCHSPDEHIDAVSLDAAETSEMQHHHQAARGDGVRKGLRGDDNNEAIKKNAQENQPLKHVSSMKLCDYDLPDEYVDAALLSFDDSDTSSYDDALPPAGDLLESVAALGCLRRIMSPKGRSSEDRNDTSETMVLADYDLPDGYVSAEVSCSSPREAIEPITQSASLSYEPHVGLSRRRREYSSTSTTASSSPTQNNLTTDCHPSSSVIQKCSTNKAGTANSPVVNTDERMPGMTPTKCDISLRKRRSVTD